VRIAALLGELRGLEERLATAYSEGADRHAAEHDVQHQARAFAKQCAAHAELLADHESNAANATEQLSGDLLHDLRALLLSAERVSITWVMAGQAAQALRDEHLLSTVRGCHVETELQVKWLTTRIKAAAPQALVVGG
jgi:hypothetical protein